MVKQTVERISGEDLRAARVAAGVSASQLARSMGVVRQRVHTLECQAAVSLPAVRRYLDALLDVAATSLSEVGA